MQCLASHLNSFINTTSNKPGRHKASCHFHGYGIDLRIPGIPIHACKSTNLGMLCYNLNIGSCHYYLCPSE